MYFLLCVECHPRHQEQRWPMLAALEELRVQGGQTDSVAKSDKPQSDQTVLEVQKGSH